MTPDSDLVIGAAVHSTTEFCHNQGTARTTEPTPACRSNVNVCGAVP
jgi:hypothetical protein